MTSLEIVYFKNDFIIRRGIVNKTYCLGDSRAAEDRNWDKKQEDNRGHHWTEAASPEALLEVHPAGEHHPEEEVLPVVRCNLAVHYNYLDICPSAVGASRVFAGSALVFAL